MLLKETEDILCKFLLSVADEEKNMEVARQILCEQVDFEPSTAFKRLDRRINGTISAANIQEFLSNNGLFYSEEQCGGIIRHYDQNNDDKLCFNDFMRCVLPQENLSLKAIVFKRKQFEVQLTELLTYDVEFALARVFEREIQAYKHFEESKSIIFKRIDYQNVKDLFSSIDMYNSGYAIGERDAVAILRYFDKNDDGVVDYNEFAYFMEQGLNICRKRNKFGDNFESEGNKLEGYRDRKATPQLYYCLNSNGQVKDKKPEDAPFNFIAASQRTNESINKHIGNTQKITKFTDDKDKQFYNKKSPFQQNTQGQRIPIELNSKVKKSRQTNNEQGELARTLKQIIHLEKEVEQAKQTLASRIDFNLLDAYRLFDVDGKGRIQCNEFQTVFKSLDLYPGRHELYLIIRRYDSDGDGYIRFAEFADMMTPIRKEFLALGKLNVNSRLENQATTTDHLAQQQQQQQQNRAEMFKKSDIFYQEHPLFSHEARVALIRVLSVMLENEAACESLRQRLHLRKHFDLKLIYHSLQQEQLQNTAQIPRPGLLSPSDFQNLFENNGIVLEQSDLLYLFSRLDKNKDSFVSLAEFIQELSPKSPQQFY